MLMMVRLLCWEGTAATVPQAGHFRDYRDHLFEGLFERGCSIGA